MKLFPYRPGFTRVSKNVIGFLLKAYFRVRVLNGDRVPKEGGLLVCPNHTSYLDAVLIGSFCPRLLKAMMMQSYYDVFPIGLIAGSWGAYPVKNDGITKETFRLSEEILRKGDALCIFPEGGRSRDGNLMPGKPGAMLLAMRDRVPVVPVGILGAFEAMPPGRAIPRHVRVTINFGAPITEHLALDYPRDKDKLPDLTALLMERIRQLLTEAKEQA